MGRMPEIKVKVSALTEGAVADLKNLKAEISQISPASAAAAKGADVLSAKMAATGHAAQRMGNSMRAANAHTTNMLFQFQDIGVMLAAGQNPLMLAMQQGTQVAGIFRQMEGTGQSAFSAIKGGLLGMVSPMSLMTIGVIAGGAALLQWAFSAGKAEDGAVTFGMKAKAAFLEVGDIIYSKFGPAIDKIAEYFSLAWNAVVGTTKWAGNTIINGITVTVDAIKTAVSVIPDAFGVSFEGAKARVMYALADMAMATNAFVRDSVASLNEVFGTSFSAPTGLERTMNSLNTMGSDAMVAGNAASANISQAWQDFTNRAAETMGRDVLGKFWSDVSARAQGMVGDTASEGGEGTSKAKKDIEDITGATEAWQSSLDGVKSGLSSVLNSMIDGTKSTAEAFKDMARNIIAQLYDILVVQRLVGGFDVATGGGSGIVGFLGKTFSGMFDGGGSIPAGSWGIAGENGPEIVTGPAHVTSRVDTARSMGGVTVVQHNSFGGGVSRAEVSAMLPSVAEAAIAGVFDAQRRSVSGMGY